ncbi:MAG TPA: IS1595 family transposase [Gammaproteobacteria bacterium]|nr:IS1595 family transposase [Gammaproteobacteria bacterium]
MLTLSHVHQLFSVETCHAYIHALQWKDRPFQCPHCHSPEVSPWGTYHYRPGFKRYRCQDCGRTFNALTKTLFAQSQRSLAHWIMATFLLCLSCSSRRIARELGVHIRTSYRWCWWLRHAAVSYEMDRRVEGTVEADELYHTAGKKGQAHQGGTKPLGRRPRRRRKKREPGRGHYDKDRPAIIAWVSRQGPVVVQAVKDFTVATVQQAADLTIEVGSRLYTDSASSYRALKGYHHEFVHHTKKEYARGEVHENRAECLFSLLRPYLRMFRGIGKSNLPGYVGFFQFLRNSRYQHAFEQAEMILQAALDPSVASKARKGEFVTCLDYFDLLQTPIN